MACFAYSPDALTYFLILIIFITCLSFTW